MATAWRGNTRGENSLGGKLSKPAMMPASWCEALAEEVGVEAREPVAATAVAVTTEELGERSPGPCEKKLRERGRRRTLGWAGKAAEGGPPPVAGMTGAAPGLGPESPADSEKVRLMSRRLRVDSERSSLARRQQAAEPATGLSDCRKGGP